MAIKMFRRRAAIAGLAAAISLAGVTGSSAQRVGSHWQAERWQDGNWRGAAIGTGAATLAAGAMVAAATSPYRYGSGYYDYAPNAVVAAPSSGYYALAGYYDYAGGNPTGTSSYDPGIVEYVGDTRVDPSVCHLDISGC